MTHDNDRTETCGICKKDVNQRRGILYYAGEEWWHYRLFICEDCHQDVAVQRTLHEQCYECVEKYPEGYAGIGIIEPLWDSRDEFEKAHEKIFDKLPATTEENEATYLGSLWRDFEKWLKEKFPDNKKST
jgi:hypothetical protein